MEETDPIVRGSSLLKRVRDVLRRKHYSTTAFAPKRRIWAGSSAILFHHKPRPSELGEREVEAVLNHLAVERQVAGSTQNQACNALVFLCRQVLGKELEQGMDLVHAKRPERLPTVFDKAEVERLLARMQGVTGLIAGLLYGTGLRLIEGLRLRVKDLDFARRQIVVRSGKGDKDRATLLPEPLISSLQYQLKQGRAVHNADLAEGLGAVCASSARDPKAPMSSRCKAACVLFGAVRRPRRGHRTGVQQWRLQHASDRRAIQRGPNDCQPGGETPWNRMIFVQWAT